MYMLHSVYYTCYALYIVCYTLYIIHAMLCILHVIFCILCMFHKDLKCWLKRSGLALAINLITELDMEKINTVTQNDHLYFCSLLIVCGRYTFRYLLFLMFLCLFFLMYAFLIKN